MSRTIHFRPWQPPSSPDRRYTLLCNEQGGILNDPVLLRLAKDEFWFSIADSDINLYLQGVPPGSQLRVAGSLHDTAAKD